MCMYSYIFVKSSGKDRVYTDVQELLVRDHSKYELCQTQ